MRCKCRSKIRDVEFLLQMFRTFSKPCLRPSRPAWGWVYPFAGQLSKPTVVGFGRRQAANAVQYLGLYCRRIDLPCCGRMALLPGRQTLNPLTHRDSVLFIVRETRA